jgi:hypothetical protein
MDIEDLMRRLAEAGVTVLLKADHERLAEGGRCWTMVISGGRLTGNGFVRAEEATAEQCVQAALQRLAAEGPDWAWVATLDFSTATET